MPASSSSPRGHGHGGPAFSVDLAAAARRLLALLRSSPPPSAAARARRSVRRYEAMWLPLASAAGGEAAMIVPPPDVQFVWLCHCFHHASYGAYCASRFGGLIDRPAILDADIEDYAADHCRDLWAARYPSEPFDLDDNADADQHTNANANASEHEHELAAMVLRHASLADRFAAPFASEGVYLVAARRRYARFLHLAKKTPAAPGRRARLVPALDILLMWLAHLSFPARYAADMAAVVGYDVAGVVVGFGEAASEEEVERTRTAWEEAYDEPYETAGTAIDAAASAAAKEAFYWEEKAVAAAEDANRRYKGLHSRFLMEVYVFLKGEFHSESSKQQKYLRLRPQRCHRSLKLDRAATSAETWRRSWHLYCEFGIRGISVELRRTAPTGCLRNSKPLQGVCFTWNELLHEVSLAVTKELGAGVRAMASVTPPVQAPYLLKCVADRITDDGGAMVSDVILRMRGYRPQEGRWLTRTVLDHGGRECFVVRMRVGRGIWRRGAESPAPVKREDRIIEVREGPWSYVAGSGSVGHAPEKVAGTATPRNGDQQQTVVWVLSTGDVLTVQRDGDGLSFLLQNESSDEAASLLVGRRLSYQVKKSDNKEEEEEHYLTLVRSSPDRPAGARATALLNWKLLAVEFLPEEDAVFMLLLCTAIARAMTEIRRVDVAGLLVRRRVREGPVGQRDWGSVTLPYSPSLGPHLQPWYRNAGEVLASREMAKGATVAKYSPTDGKDALYRQALIP